MPFKLFEAIPENQVTQKELFLARRRFIKSAGCLLTATGLGLDVSPALARPGKAVTGLPVGPYSADLEPTPREHVQSYNNFYEFSTDKEAPARLAQAMKTDPWSVAVEGEVEKPGIYHLEDILKHHPLQTRIYRFRCVEGWAMVVPWIGFPLGDLLKRFGPTSRAKYVTFTSHFDPQIMPGVRSSILDWPYREGLRLDEAMHPLTFMAVGMYDDVLPNQNGAPLRLVVPWKYGFKSIKSVVRLRLMETLPATAWNKRSPSEYGFYANVNPNVPHPRWSQRSERLLGSPLFSPRRKTELFNGYGEQVASLYRGMDMRRHP